jgi:hypothetical protein
MDRLHTSGGYDFPHQPMTSEREKQCSGIPVSKVADALCV